MRKFLSTIFILICLVSLVKADTAFPLETMTRKELEALKTAINSELKSNHETSSVEQQKISTLVKSTVENLFSQREISVSWAWVNYTYSKDWNFYTMSTHIDYKDSKSNKHKSNVYAEAYNVNGSYQLFYLKIGDELVTDNRAALPPDYYLAFGEKKTMIEHVSVDPSSIIEEEESLLSSQEEQSIPDSLAINAAALGDTFETYELEELEQLNLRLTDVLNSKRLGNIKIILSKDNINLAKGKTEKISYELKGRDLSKNDTVTWISSKSDVAIVSKEGTVTGKAPGTSNITCQITFEDGAVLSANANIKVILPVTLVKLSKTAVTLFPDATLDAKALASVQPANASLAKLAWHSDNKAIATVSDEGMITALAPGSCKITASSTDGTEKSASISLFVPTLSSAQTEYIVKEKAGMTIYAKYFGDNPGAVNVKANGNAAEIISRIEDSTVRIDITPIRYGSTTLTVSDKTSEKSKLTLKITVDHSAVYDKTSYPTLNYKEAHRYPGQYKGNQVSFSGKVLQVMEGGWLSDKTLRISSKGSYDDVVYVTISDENDVVPILEDDRVIVYGVLNGNQSYTSIFGASITIPEVTADRININRQ